MRLILEVKPPLETPQLLQHHPAQGGDPAGPVLAAFDGELLAGDWTLTVSDHAAADSGTLDLWCLAATVDTMPFLADFEEGDLSEWSSSQP